MEGNQATTRNNIENGRIHPDNKALGIIFDVDGTLIAEGDSIPGIVHRPGAIEYLYWLAKRGHAIALWTAAWSGHADRVAASFCRAIQQEQQRYDEQQQQQQQQQQQRAQNGNEEDHQCHGRSMCRNIFDFVWDKTKLRCQRKTNLYYHDDNEGLLDNGLFCQWCQMYKTRCKRCTCFCAAPYCSCRYTKDLSKVWSDPTHETARFVKERTLIVENTPQQCIWNYGNAIYVPTYRGGYQRGNDERNMFARLKRLILELEQVDNVRTVQKCSHKQGPHACFEQDWWYYPLNDDRVIAEEKEPEFCVVIETSHQQSTDCLDDVL